MDVSVTVGRERYQEWHNVVLGLSLKTRLDLWPDPDFQIGPVLSYHHTTSRRELASPESRLEKAASKPSKDQPEGMASSEGWNMWLAIFGFGHYKTILSQEHVVARQVTFSPNQ